MSPHLLSGAARLAGSSLLRMQSDERLVALVRDGHDPAFAAVVDRYQGELVRYSARLVGESRAEDVVQQAFLSAHMALRANDNAIQLRPWLYRIAHNAGLNVLRAARPDAELDDRLAAPGGIEQSLETRERLRAAFDAIARLPEPQRDALTLRAIEGRSHVEIAEALGISPGAARQHLHRARTTIRAAVSAITPYGLMVRLAMAGTDGGGFAPVAATTAGAGAVATVAKVGAGILAAGALGVGASHLPLLHAQHGARAHGRAAPAAVEAVRNVPPPVAGPRAAHSAEPVRSRRHEAAVGARRRDGHLGEGDSRRSRFGESRGDGSSPSESGGGHEGTSGSGDGHSGSDGGHSGSGGSTTTTTSGDGGSGSGDSAITTTGSRDGGGSGSDGGTTGTSGTDGGGGGSSSSDGS